MQIKQRIAVITLMILIPLFGQNKKKGGTKSSKKKIIVDDLNCIKTSFPNFVSLMKGLGRNF